MTLNEIEKTAGTSDKPVVEKIYHTDGLKLIAIAMKSGVVLSEHKAPAKAKLVVIKGEIDFNTETDSIRLAAPDSLDIPLDVTHSVRAFEDALFLLLLEQN